MQQISQQTVNWLDILQNKFIYLIFLLKDTSNINQMDNQGVTNWLWLIILGGYYFISAVFLCFPNIIHKRKKTHHTNFEKISTSNKIFCIAHRGGAYQNPENTMQAFQKANQICDILEMDVCGTSDGYLVTNHDQDLWRIYGEHQIISELKYYDPKKKEEKEQEKKKKKEEEEEKKRERENKDKDNKGKPNEKGNQKQEQEKKKKEEEKKKEEKKKKEEEEKEKEKDEDEEEGKKGEELFIQNIEFQRQYLPQGYPECCKEMMAGNNCKIPLFQDVLKKFPDTIMLIDLKTPELKQLDQSKNLQGYDWPIQELNRLIRKYQREEYTIWVTRDSKLNAKMQEINPKIITAYSQKEIIRMIILFILGLLPFVCLRKGCIVMPFTSTKTFKHQSKGYLGSKKLIRYIGHKFLNLFTRFFVRNLRMRGILTFLYTLNEQRQFQAALSIGAKGIVTDRPNELTKYLKDRHYYLKRKTDNSNKNKQEQKDKLKQEKRQVEI